MAAPNIVGVATLTGISTTRALTVVPEVVVANTVGSNRVYKINTILIANMDGSSSADVNVRYHPHSPTGAGTSFAIGSTGAVAADSTLVTIDRASSWYLEEGQSLVAYASASGDLDCLCSYEIIQ